MYMWLIKVTTASKNSVATVKFITKWGSTGTADGQFHSPSGVAVDSSGNVYVSDSTNNRVQVFGPNARTSTEIKNLIARSL